MKLTRSRILARLAVLTLAIALTMVALPPSEASWSWFKLNDRGSHVDIYSEPGFRKGRLKCRPAHNEVFSLGGTSVAGGAQVSSDGKYVFVAWRKKLGTLEWHWKDKFGKWCPLWDRQGWVELKRLNGIPRPEGHWIF